LPSSLRFDEFLFCSELSFFLHSKVHVFSFPLESKIANRSICFSLHQSTQGGKSGGKSGAKGGKAKVKAASNGKKNPTSRSARAGLQVLAENAVRFRSEL
jgi:hypothetical protein